MNSMAPSMIEDSGCIDYDESGAGPTIVLVPGSCSTGAAWRPIIGRWDSRFRCVTTSLLGYGGTAERRTAQDASIAHETDVIETVIRKAGGPVHLVGHSFGGLVSLGVMLRNRVPLASVTIIEAPLMELLRDRQEQQHYGTFRRMTDRYFAEFEAGNREAIATMIDFYGGPGTFASWPARVRAYAVETMPVNILDWASAYSFPLSAAALAAIDIPVLVVRGGASPAAMQRAHALLRECLSTATLVTIQGAAHFMLATHADQVSGVIARHVQAVEGGVVRGADFAAFRDIHRTGGDSAGLGSDKTRITETAPYGTKRSHAEDPLTSRKQMVPSELRVTGPSICHSKCIRTRKGASVRGREAPSVSPLEIRLPVGDRLRFGGFCYLVPDFAEILAATRRRRPSVLQIRSDRLSPAAIGTVFLRAVDQTRDDLANGALISVDPQRTRVRILPLDP
jgi:pimeloyl-ACP methyl ester carboxylesterase